MDLIKEVGLNKRAAKEEDDERRIKLHISRLVLDIEMCFTHKSIWEYIHGAKNVRTLCVLATSIRT